MANTTDKVLRLAAKLLAVQETRGASQAEAEHAAERLQQLLQDHNLTLSQVESSQDGSLPVASRVKDAMKMRSNTVYSEKWRSILLEGVAQNNFCLGHKSSAGTFEQLVLVGREINVNVTKMTYDYLAQNFIRAAKELGLTPHHTTRRDYIYFMDGAVRKVIERLNTRRAEREAEDEKRAQPATGNGTHRELVLSDVYGSEADLNNDALNGFPAGTSANNRRKNQERRVQQEVEHNRLVAEGVDSTVAWYRAYGYSETLAAQYAKQYKRSRRSSHRHGAQNWSRRNEREYQKLNSDAYKSGLKVGSSVGLDGQVGAASTMRITKK